MSCRLDYEAQDHCITDQQADRYPADSFHSQDSAFDAPLTLSSSRRTDRAPELEGCSQGEP